MLLCLTSVHKRVCTYECVTFNPLYLYCLCLQTPGHPINLSSSFQTSQLSHIYPHFILTFLTLRSLNNFPPTPTPNPTAPLPITIPRRERCLLGNEGLWTYQSYLISLKGPLINTNTHSVSHTYPHTLVLAHQAAERCIKRGQDGRGEETEGAERRGDETRLKVGVWWVGGWVRGNRGRALW